MDNAGYTDTSNGGVRKRVGVNGEASGDPSDNGSVVIENNVQMKKQVGLVSGIALIVGTMIGSGIFISPVGVLSATGSVGASLLVWSGCGVIAMLGALSYADLGTMIRKSGGEYAYLLEAFGPVLAYIEAWVSSVLIRPSSMAIICLSFGSYVATPIFDDCGPPEITVKLLAAAAILKLYNQTSGAMSYAELGTMIPKSGAEYPYLYEALGPVPAYLFSWISTVTIRPSSFAIICLAFADYVANPLFDGCGPPEIVRKCLAATAILTIAIVNCYSVRLAARVQVFFTVVKLAALIVIIIGGIVKLAEGNTVFLSEGFKDSNTNPSVIALAFYDGLWAYDGWNNLNFVTEELKDPNKNLPRSILIGIPLVTVVYILTNISYLTVMSKETILISSAVAVTWGDRVLGAAKAIIPIAVACSTFGAANGTCFTGGRLCYVAAREGHLPSLLSYVHVKQYTPLPSLIFTTIIALLMIIPGDISSLIDFFSFTVWLFYGLTFFALIVMRFTRKDWERPYKVPIIIPITALLIAIYLVIAPIVQDPKVEFLYAAIFVVGGLIFYLPFVHFKWKLPGMDPLTTGCQLFLECAPSKYEPES